MFVYKCANIYFALVSLLEWSLDPKSGIRRQDSQTVFASVAQNPLGQSMVFDFALKNWERIVKAYVTVRSFLWLHANKDIC